VFELSKGIADETAQIIYTITVVFIQLLVMDYTINERDRGN
jgi:hypothetical protein